jgi:hypothetical protein
MTIRAIFAPLSGATDPTVGQHERAAENRLTVAGYGRDNRTVAYDEDLADRIREIVGSERGVSEKKMFGGLAFLINGNMAVSASGKGGILLRVDPAQTDKLAENQHASVAIMQGRAMDGWLRIAPDGIRTKRQLERWATRGVGYARSLPPKRK